MKNVLKICSLVTAMICVLAVTAAATPINSPASCSGAFIVGSDCDDAKPGMVLPSLSPSPLASLQAFIFDVKSYNFDATGININRPKSHTIAINWHGIANIFGFDWSLGKKRAVETNSLPISTEVNAVPEPATMFLLGSGLIWIGALGRRKKSDKE